MEHRNNNRKEKAAEFLVHLAAEYIAREAGRSTLITPMRADMSPDRKNAIIYVSVFPEAEDQHAIEFLTRHRDLFREYLKKRARFSALPFVRFEIDYGERNRQRLDEISHNPQF